MGWETYGKKNRSEQDADYLPRVRTADYDELSVSTQSGQDVVVKPFIGALSDELDGSCGKALLNTGDALSTEPQILEASEVNRPTNPPQQALEDSKEAHVDAENTAYTFTQQLENSHHQSCLETQGSEVIKHDLQQRKEPESVSEIVVQPETAFSPDLSRVPRASRSKRSSVIEESDDVSVGERKEKCSGDELGRGDQDWFDDGVSDSNKDGNQNEDSDKEDDEDDHDDESYNGASISTWSGMSHFTEISRIDLDKQTQGKWDYRNGQLYYLGSIWDVRSRRYECDLCRRFWRRTRRNTDVKNNFMFKSRCILKLIELKAYIYGYKLDDPENSEWIINTPFVLQGTHRDITDLQCEASPNRGVHFADNLWGQARWRKRICDFELFKKWLKMCETKHVHSLREYSNNILIRLIDVEQNCLIEWIGSATEVPRYVALSYIWGVSQQQVMLTKAALNDFKQPGFFFRPLNRTIRDAIDLVSEMGENYLWIDALCILQDIAEDKATQIPQMNIVYGNAVLTIIAAYGDNADAGLPGVSRGSRRGSGFQLELDDIQISARSETNFFATQLAIGFMENYLGYSAYVSRAWTFQEGLLSPRVLVFTKDQVFWECDRCTWCEETHWESDTVDFVGWRAVKDPTPDDIWIDNFDRNAYDMRSLDEPEMPEPLRNSYASLVRQYSPRLLTHDADILNACTGVLQSIEGREESNFLFALRTRFFGNDLLFNPTKILLPRFPAENPVESGFPTWSWLAWKGQIEIANEPRYNSYDPVENLLPCDGVKCYTLRADESGRKSLQVINEAGGWRFQEDYVRKGEGIIDPTLDIDQVPQVSNDIPEYLQNITLADMERHPAFPQMVPNFHIIFYTFCSTIILRTDNYGPRRRERKLYACKKRIYFGSQTWSLDTASQANTEHKSTTTPESSDVASQEDESENSLEMLPEGFECGPYCGHLPRATDYQSHNDYMTAIPDGIYRLLWMNNNQLPMWGHLLCKPTAVSASKDGDWDGEILQRVAPATGATDILSLGQQEKFAVEWKLVILG